MGFMVARSALYAAALIACGSFGLLFSGGLMPVFLGAGLVGAAVGSLRPSGSVLLLPATGLYTLIATYGNLLIAGTGWRLLVEQVSRDLDQAVATMWASPVPYEASPGLLALATPAAILVAHVATSATVHWDNPVASVAVLGVTIGTLSMASFEIGAGPYFALFMVCALTLLLLSGEGGARLRGALAAALVAAGVLLLPVMAPAALGWSVKLEMEEFGWLQIGAPRIDAQASVGEYLNNKRETELFEVESPEPLRWRAGTLDRYDGGRWESTIGAAADDGREKAPGVEARRVEQTVRISGAQTDLFFGGYEATSVSAPGAERRPDGSWASAEPLQSGYEYELVSEVPEPTVEQLRDAGSDFPPEVRARFLQLPGGLPPEVVETADEIQGVYDPGTSYEKSRAIERYLLEDGGFSYDLSADYTSPDRALGEFLGGERRGFCVQFASSMALLAREMGVPSRIVYGATSGERVDGRYVVRGKNMHMWAEVYLPGVGWHPFDPTPGVGANQETLAPAAGPPEPHEAAAEQGAQTAGFGGMPLPVSPVAGALALAVLAVAGLAGGVLLAKRLLAARGTSQALYYDLLGRLQDLPGSKASTTFLPALTPIERLVVAARAQRLDPEPFEVFARAYSEHLYSQSPRADVYGPYRDVLRTLRSLSPRRRLRAALNPASLLTRLWKGLLSRWSGRL